MIKKVTNIKGYTIGSNAISEIPSLLAAKRENKNDFVVFLIDQYFKGNDEIIQKLNIFGSDLLIYASTNSEPTTDYVNQLMRDIKQMKSSLPIAIVGIGGGSTLDLTKAVANLCTNPGPAENYQGWDLVKNPAIYKIAVPTLSGTGAEASRTCVLTNKNTGVKLGMNSDHTLYDHIIMDPDLTSTVPRDQYFYTGMDTFIHSFESLEGHFRNPIGDAYSREALQICSNVFSGDDMMSESNRADLMVASYLGGSAIATSYVGLVHPLSAGLSVVLGYHHCVANCIVMRSMREFYPGAFEKFWNMAEANSISIPSGVTSMLSDEQYQALYQSTMVHERPLQNALGADYKNILTIDKVTELFKGM